MPRDSSFDKAKIEIKYIGNEYCVGTKFKIINYDCVF